MYGAPYSRIGRHCRFWRKAELIPDNWYGSGIPGRKSCHSVAEEEIALIGCYPKDTPYGKFAHEPGFCARYESVF